MFDTIGASGRTRKPWTVAVSFAGQLALIGVAVLVPLVTTQTLPHSRLISFLLPEPPPPAAVHQKRPVQPKPSKLVPFEMKPSGVVQAPSEVPQKVVMLKDPDFQPAVSGPEGVPYGLGPAGGGNSVIQNLLPPAPVPPPPPPVAKAPATPAPAPRIRVGGKVEMGRLISGPRPEYPPLARAARISGVVKLQAIIAVDGTIMNLHVVAGHPLLVSAALAAVKQWRFQPAFLNGIPVEVATDIEVNFVLQQ
jgi:periplasmic protein TonB